MPKRRAPSILAALLLLAGAQSLCAQIERTAQIEEADLPVHEDQEGVAAQTLELFDSAEDLLNAGQLEPALASLDEVIAALEHGPTPLLRGARDLWVRAVARRAAVRIALGEPASSIDADLATLITLDPGFTFEEGAATPELAASLEASRGERVGRVAVQLAPPDAAVEAISWPSEPSPQAPIPKIAPASTRLPAQQETSLLAGRYRITARRAGYTEQSRELEVVAGEARPVELALERSSAAVQLATRPSGATVLVDGATAGVTGGTAGPELRLSGTDHLPAEYSAYLWIDGLLVGTHEVEIKKDGYRPFRARLAVDELRDIKVQPVALEPEMATVLLDGLPEGATVEANGRVAMPLATADKAVRQLQLPPGAYRLFISRGPSAVFETELDLADRQTLELEVRLRPGVVLLGVLGGDASVVGRVRDALEDVLGNAEGSTLLDRSALGTQLVAGLGLTVARLRELGQRADGAAAPEWPRLQAAASDRIDAWIYALAVLDDDLLAREVQLWLFPPAGAPPRPDLRRVRLDDWSELERVAGALVPELDTPRPYLGALLIDSAASGAPVVAHLMRGGAAAAAGLNLGDAIISLARTPTFTVAQLLAAIAPLAPGRFVELEVRTPGSVDTITRTLTLQLGASRAALDLNDPDIIFATRAAELARALQREGSEVPRWQFLLDQALLELRAGAWERAVEILRGIRAPANPGLGQGTIDYLLGLALTRLSPRYDSRAREAFERAATSEGRLLSDDGPWLAPLARARLAALGAPGAP